MKKTKCCDEPWPAQTWGFVDFWFCQNCGKVLPDHANRTNGRARVKVVKEGKTTTLDSF